MKINFCHRYHKLSGQTFTTIRGKSWFNKIKVGETVTCHAPGEKDFPCLVGRKELVTISQMPIEFLKSDAEYPGFTFDNHLAFVALLNSFRRRTKIKLCADDEVTVLTLQRL